jgi:hypothetical protein
MMKKGIASPVDLHVVSIIGSRMTVSGKIVLAGFAIVATMLALFFAVLVAGPLVRALFGVPAGFHEHFVSPSAYRQALSLQVVSVSFAFLMLGTALGGRVKRDRFSRSLWVANPITVGVGFATYKWFYQLLRFAGYLPEYDSPSTFALFVLAAPVVFASCFFAGEYLRNLPRANP